MEVLTESDSPVLISNAEVLEMISQNIDRRKAAEARNSKKKRRRDKPSKFIHRDWIEENVYRYLQRTPCVDISDPLKLKSKLMASKKQQTNINGNYSNANKRTGFDLTEAESLQIVNFLPKEPVEIHLMVEEMHARMSEERQGELLELIISHRKDGGEKLDHRAEGNAEGVAEILKPIKTELWNSKT